MKQSMRKDLTEASHSVEAAMVEMGDEWEGSKAYWKCQRADHIIRRLLSKRD